MFRTLPRNLAFSAILLLSASCSLLNRGPDPANLLDPANEVFDAAAPAQFLVNFTTTRGDFVVEVNRDWAPRGADRFFNLIRHGYYNGVHFFRVIPGFVAQFGIPADPALADIWTKQRMLDDPVVEGNVRGTISFASGGPDTRTTQVFINTADNRRLDSLGFTPFGRVVDGMDIVDALFGGYGEGPPRGNGPEQDRIESEGATYLINEFPNMDSVIEARIVRR